MCRGIARGALSDAIAGGACTVAALAERTGASTVCGSCKPLLGNLLGSLDRVPIARTLLVASIVAAVLVALAFALTIPYRASVQTAWAWDVVWTDATLKQTSGFALLALALLVSALALRKRIPWFTWASFSSWQAVHAAVGALGVVALGAHTGFRFGANLNLWLMLCFTGLVAAGAVAGVATALAPRAAAARAPAVRRAALWTHIVLLWPLPVLLGFHVLKGYWF